MIANRVAVTTGDRRPLREVSTRIKIAAAPETVWGILTDLPRYPEWNPLFREATGQITVGGQVTLRSVNPSSGTLMTVKAKVTVANPAAELRWVSSLPGIISGEHVFTLTPADGGTLLTQRETYGGLLSVIAGKRLEAAGPSFDAMNQALKARAESRD